MTIYIINKYKKFFYKILKIKNIKNYFHNYKDKLYNLIIKLSKMKNK
jgi:hypothetical protein